MVVTADEVMAYEGIDYADEMVIKNIERTIKTAHAYLQGSIGVNYPTDDPRAKELALVVVSELYNKRGMVESLSGNTRRLISDFSMQLRLELAANE